MPSLSWLDFSEHDRRRALEVIELFRDKDTVDELGIGSVRDAIAEVLFPGTSIIHTRARYFFFVPWIYQRLEQKRIPANKMAAEARRAELALVEKLLASGETEGVIGRLARQNLKILPSAIYWQALHRVGFRLFPGTRDQYHRSLDRFYATGTRGLRNDDDEVVDVIRSRNWDPKLPPAPKHFPDGAKLAMTRSEAEFLRDRIVFMARDSLYRVLVEMDEAPADSSAPWEFDAFGRLKAVHREQLLHARNFSEAMHGAALLYNLMLAELTANKELATQYSTAIAEWRDAYAERAKEFGDWDRRRFWDMVRTAGGQTPLPTQGFVERWLDLAHRLSSKQLAASKEARTLVHERERQLKRGQARLDSPRARSLWQGAAGTRRLTYRWGIAVRIARDIQDGLRNRSDDA